MTPSQRKRLEAALKRRKAGASEDFSAIPEEAKEEEAKQIPYYLRPVEKRTPPSSCSESSEEESEEDEASDMVRKDTS